MLLVDYPELSDRSLSPVMNVESRRIPELMLWASLGALAGAVSQLVVWAAWSEVLSSRISAAELAQQTPDVVWVPLVVPSGIALLWLVSDRSTRSRLGAHAFSITHIVIYARRWQANYDDPYGSEYTAAVFLAVAVAAAIELLAYRDKPRSPGWWKIRL